MSTPKRDVASIPSIEAGNQPTKFNFPSLSSSSSYAESKTPGITDSIWFPVCFYGIVAGLVCYVVLKLADPIIVQKTDTEGHPLGEFDPIRGIVASVVVALIVGTVVYSIYQGDHK